jgi:hypothetical protein
MRQLCSALVFSLICSLASTQNPYVPANRPDGTRQTKASWSVSEWGCLGPMGEPSLSDVSDQETRAYRFLYLHSMRSEPIVVRISIRPDGTGEVTTKVLRYRDDCKRGKLTKNKKRDVPKKAVDSLLKKIEEAGFWRLPTNDSRIGLDGSSWIVEGVNDGNYHAVNRWSPEKGTYKRLGMEFLKVGRVRVETY